MTMKTIYPGLSILIFSLIPLNLFGQNLLRNPEHVAYDPLNQRYLVTNYGNGTIVSISGTGEQQVVLTGLKGCMGIHVKDTLLIVSCGKKITFLDVTTLRQYREVSLNATSWLDGIITDHANFAYAVESAGKIFRINLETFEANIIVTQGIPPYAQDLAYDPVNNRLIVVAWEVNSPIKAVDLSDFNVSTLQSTQLGNFDGIVRDTIGNLYVSSHRNGGKVYRFDHSFLQAPKVICTGLISPAGLCLNDAGNVIAVPDFDGNSVTFINDIYSGIELPFCTDPEDIRIIGHELVVATREPCRAVSLYTIDGRMIWSGKPDSAPYHLNLDPIRRFFNNKIMIIHVQGVSKSFTGKFFLSE